MRDHDEGGSCRRELKEKKDEQEKGIITLVVFFVLLAGLGYVSVFGVGRDRSGSAASIKPGLDLAGGVRCV